MKIKINCTKEHLEHAKYCGINTSKQPFPGKGISSNCWIAIACQEIFPECNVGSTNIVNETRYNIGTDKKMWTINIPQQASEEIIRFDGCLSIEGREKLKPFFFDIDIDEKTLDTILECNGFGTISNFEEIINATPHLELLIK